VAKRRKRRRFGFGMRAAALVLGVAAGALAVWSWSRLGEGGGQNAAAPAEEIRPAERARLDAVLEDLGKDDSGGKSDRR
jgi:ferric-dicitrate binding protein FerR (iron transport regulator)